MSKYLVILFSLAFVLITHEEVKGITIDFTGHIDAFRNDGGIINGDVNVGDKVMGSLTYELEVGSNNLPGDHHQAFITFDLEYSLENGITFWALDNNGYCLIENNNEFGADSLEHYWGRGGSNSERDAYMADDSYLRLFDATGTVFSVEGLSSPLKPNSFDSGQLLIISSDVDTQDIYTINMVFDSFITPVPVPEPASIFMVSTGLLLLGFLMRKKKD